MGSSARHHTLRSWGSVKSNDASLLLLGISALLLLMLGQRAAQVLALSPALVFACKALLVAPWIEELFFRGVVHAALLRRRPRVQPWAANALTALCFGLAHWAYVPWFHALAVMAPALLIGWVYGRARKVWMCVTLHSFCNLLWILWGYS